MQQKIEAIIQQHDIILFDEICVLCNGWAKFLIKYYTLAQFKLTSVQSPLGQDILRHYQMPTEQFDSMLVIKNGLWDTQIYPRFSIPPSRFKSLSFIWYN